MEKKFISVMNFPSRPGHPDYEGPAFYAHSYEEAEKLAKEAVITVMGDSAEKACCHSTEKCEEEVK